MNPAVIDTGGVVPSAVDGPEPSQTVETGCLTAVACQFPVMSGACTAGVLVVRTSSGGQLDYSGSTATYLPNRANQRTSTQVHASRLERGTRIRYKRSSTQAHHASVSYGHPPPAPSSDKKKSKKKDRKSSKGTKQNEALLGVGSQFDDDTYPDGSAGSGGHYPQDLVID
ncbi:hypothetical protein PG994_000795 [Apiospora phragmitis]|uniref:Uncharacterized protein n=1 Tax=Apiospora phragmitis TaxID=2905665 RepID=A0ABR1X766_9PEZI